MAVTEENKGTAPAPAVKSSLSDTQLVDAAVEGVITKKLNSRKKTAGEKIFDRTVYTGIGFVLNEVMSLIFADKFEHGSGKYIGKQGFDNASAWIAKTFQFKAKTTEAGKTISAHKSAGNSLLWVSLTSGGFLLLLPMKWMENRKRGWVKTFNHLADKFSSHRLSREEIAARDAEVDEVLAIEPKQTWGSILKGRFIAIGASIGLGTMLGEQRSEKIKETSDWLLTQATEKTTLNRWFSGETFHRYARLTGVETVSCATASIVLEAVSKFFAHKKPIPKDPTIYDAVKTREQADLFARLHSRRKKEPESTYAAAVGQRKAITEPVSAYTEKVAQAAETLPQAAI